MGWGFFSQRKSARTPDNQLQTPSRINTMTFLYPPWKIPCVQLEEYEEVLETAPLDFLEDDVTWVASNLSGATWAMRAKTIELRNCLLSFECPSEEFRVVNVNFPD